MPVIREKKNFAIGPIGVARVSAGVAGSNAAGAVANAVADGANQMADMFFRQGAQAAEKAGLEQGSAVAQEKVLAIDPKTGEPVAYDAPQGFGTIAQEAYQRVVLSRFQTGIEQEIKLKAQEFAAKYDGSVSRYTAAMSDYIGAMTESADGQFKTYIKDVGTSYLNATRSAMAIDQIKRERAAAASSLGDSIGEGVNFLEWQYSQSGPEAAAAGPTMTNATELGVQKAIDDGVTSGLIAPDKSKAALNEIELAKARGLIRFAATQSDVTSDELALLKNGLGSGDYGIIPKKFSYVQEALVGFSGNFEAQADLGKLGASLLDDKVAAVKIAEQQAIADAKTNDALTAASIGMNATQSTSFATQRGYSNPTTAIALLSEEYSNFNERILTAVEEGNTETAKALAETRDKSATNTVTGIGLNIFKGMNQDDTYRVEEALDNFDPELAPESARAGVRAILQLEDVVSGSIETIKTMAGSHRDGAGKLNQREAEQEAFVNFSNIASKEFGKISASTGEKVEENLFAFQNKMATTPNLTDEDKKDFNTQALINAGFGHLSGFFQTNPSQTQIQEAIVYLADKSGGDNLTAKQKDSLSRASYYGDASDNRSRLDTRFNSLKQIADDRFKASEEERIRYTTLRSIDIGTADPKSESNQKVIGDWFSQTYGKPASEILLDPSRPEHMSVLGAVSNASVLPQDVVDMFKAASGGSLNATQGLAALSAWENVRTKTDVNGAEVLSTSIDALKPEEITWLNLALEYTRVKGSSAEAYTELMQAKNEFLNNPASKAGLEEALGGTVEEFILSLDNIENVPQAAFDTIYASAITMFATQSVTGFDVSSIQKRLAAQLKQSYPNGNGIVFGANNKPFTGAALSRTAQGFEAEFTTYTGNLVSNSGVFVSKDTNTLQTMKDVYVGLSPFLQPTAESALRSPNFFRAGMPRTPQETTRPRVYLVPFESDGRIDTRYRVMISRPVEDGGPQPVLQPIRSREGETYYQPLIVSPADAAFVKIKEDIIARRMIVTPREEGFRAQLLKGTLK